MYCKSRRLVTFSDFNIVSVTGLILEIGPISTVAPTCIPDHSVLLCNIQTNDLRQEMCENVAQPEQIPFDKFKLSEVPNYFLFSDEVLTKVYETIARLEGSFRVQSDIDESYTNWCNIVQDEVYGKLPFKTIKMACTGNKKRRVGKPW